MKPHERELTLLRILAASLSVADDLRFTYTWQAQGRRVGALETAHNALLLWNLEYGEQGIAAALDAMGIGELPALDEGERAA